MPEDVDLQQDRAELHALFVRAVSGVELAHGLQPRGPSAYGLRRVALSGALATLAILIAVLGVVAIDSRDSARQGHVSVLTPSSASEPSLAGSTTGAYSPTTMEVGGVDLPSIAATDPDSARSEFGRLYFSPDAPGHDELIRRGVTVIGIGTQSFAKPSRVLVIQIPPESNVEHARQVLLSLFEHPEVVSVEVWNRVQPQ